MKSALFLLGILAKSSTHANTASTDKTSATDKEAYARTLAFSWWNSHKGEIRRAKLNKDYMFSVRCVRDAK